MHIAVDREHATRIDGCANVGIAQIEPHVVTVDLERGGVFLRGGVELVHRRLKSGATVDDAASGMADHMHERMTNRLEQPLGGNLGLLLQRRVRTRNNPIEFRKKFVAVVERTVAEDVDLAARPDLHLRMAGARLVNRLDVRAQS